MKNSRW